MALTCDDVPPPITEILSFVSLSYKLFAVDEDDDAPFRLRRPNHLGPSGIGGHRPIDYRSQKRNRVDGNPVPHKTLGHPRPGVFAGGVCGYPATTEAHGLLFLGISVVADRLAVRA